jgi:hypothetical protein
MTISNGPALHLAQTPKWLSRLYDYVGAHNKRAPV